MVRFKNYRPIDKEMRVMLLYLLLNGGDLSKVNTLQTEVRHRKNGGTQEKIYSKTTEFIDVRKIENDIDEIPVPTIHDEYSVQIALTTPTIYEYKALHKEHPLFVNDMGIISRNMYIASDQIVTENLAKPLVDCNYRGFMFFRDYILNNECVAGKWKISYSNYTFSIYYNSETENGNEWLLLYSVVGIEKIDTYKLTIYTIMKACLTVDEWLPDNYSVTELKIKSEGVTI